MKDVQVLIIGDGGSISSQIRQVLRDHGHSDVLIVDSNPAPTPNKSIYYLGEEPTLNQMYKLIKPLEHIIDYKEKNHPDGWYRKFDKVNKRK